MKRTVITCSIAASLRVVGTLPTCILSTAYSATLSAFGGTGTGYKFTPDPAQSLPSGLSGTDNGDGTYTISGTTAVPGLVSVYGVLSDSDRTQASYSFTFIVLALPLSISGGLSGGTTATPASGSYSASGGFGGYTFSVVSGTPPCTINSDGTVSGNWGSAGSYSWTVRVTDSMGGTSDFPDNCTVDAAALTLTGSFGNIYDTGDSGSTAGSLTIGGGISPYSISGSGLASGSLPPGLSLSVSGSTLVLTGTATAYGSYTFVPQVNSSDSQTASGPSQTIVVGNPHFSSVVSQQDWSGTVVASSVDDLVASHSDFFWGLQNGASVSSGAGPFGDNAVSIAGSGSTQHIRTNTSSSTLGMGTSDYIVESWVKFSTDTHYRNCFDFRPGSNGFYPSYLASTSASSNQIVDTFNGVENTYTPSSAPTTGTWYHIAIARISGVRYILFNGYVFGGASDTNSYPSTQVVIGANPFDVSSNGLNGLTAQWRVTKGYAAYYGNLSGSTYTPPSRAFPKGGI